MALAPLTKFCTVLVENLEAASLYSVYWQQTIGGYHLGDPDICHLKTDNRRAGPLPIFQSLKTDHFSTLFNFSLVFCLTLLGI